MCGIAGFTRSDIPLMRQVLDLIQHRGPDDNGIWATEKLTLGQVRLSILDLSEAGFQPLFYHPQYGASSEKYHPEWMEKSPIGIVFNGEIYNFKEIRQELKNKGYQFTTACDTEVLPAAYLEWGTNFVQKLNGMWAFCLFDKSKNQLVLSIDRTGQKPLYFYQNGDNFAFGSELKTITATGIPKEIDTDALNYYLIFGYTPSDQSILKGVQKFLPAHTLIFDLTDSQIKSYQPYWEIEFSDKITDEQEAQEKIYETLRDSVRMRMLADVPVGAFLSGGVDSSAIVSIMRDYVSELKTFSVGFDYEAYNESSWAKIIAQKFETDHYEINFSAQDVRELIDILPYHFDNPFGDSSMIPTFLVSKVARKHVTVCLSGTGGDELFAGYTRHWEYQILRKLHQLPEFIKIFPILGYQLINKDKGGKLAELLREKNPQTLYLKLFTHLFRSKNEPNVNFDQVLSLNELLENSDELTRLLNFDQKNYLSNDLLVKEDRATMANSLEGRIPFLDFRMIELANNISSKLKLRGKNGKYILKKTLEGNIPNEILYRPKKGFGVPIREYFQKELKTYIEDILFDFQDYEYYDKALIRQLWEVHQAGKSDYSPLFWNLIMFNKWFKHK